MDIDTQSSTMKPSDPGWNQHITELFATVPNNVLDIFIATVQCFPNLYDASRPDYKDTIATANTWKTIAEQMGHHHINGE